MRHVLRHRNGQFSRRDEQDAKPLERLAFEILGVALVLPADEVVVVEIDRLENPFVGIAQDFRATVDLNEKQRGVTVFFKRKDPIGREVDALFRVFEEAHHRRDVAPNLF